MSARVLVVDDQIEVVRWIVEELVDEGYTATGTASAHEAIAQVQDLTTSPDLVIADVEMPEMRGLELLAKLRGVRPSLPVILITAFGSVELAVTALRAGATDFLTKPFVIEALLLAVERTLDLKRRPTARTSSLGHDEGIIARSEPMRRALDRARRAARVSSSVLLLGETGAGKGTLARFIHASGPRADAPFLQLNCAAIPLPLLESELFGVRRGAFTDAREDRDGLFVRANGGTIFLDEIGDLPLAAQPKLLNVLETGRVRALGAAHERTVDVRIIAATHQDLPEAVQNRTFRADLMFRLRVIQIDLPPLRARPEDLPALVERLLPQLSVRIGRTVHGVTDEALGWLCAQPWPGNIRELQNLLEQAIALGEGSLITLDDLNASAMSPPSGQGTLEHAADRGLPLHDIELSYMRLVLARVGGNHSEAARRLGVDRRTLARRLGEPNSEDP